MYHTTGFRKPDVTELAARVCALVGPDGERPWPPILGLFKSMLVTLTYPRRNRVQAEIGEMFGCPSRRSVGRSPL
jgi:hypothetical protein